MFLLSPSLGKQYDDLKVGPKEAENEPSVMVEQTQEGLSQSLAPPPAGTAGKNCCRTAPTRRHVLGSG